MARRNELSRIAALPALLCAAPALAHRCAVCEAPTRTYCGRCHRVAYCGREHQSRDWPVHQHVCSTRRADGAGAGAGMPVASPAAEQHLRIAVRGQDNRSGRVSGPVQFSAHAKATRKVALVLAKVQGGTWDYYFSHDRADLLAEKGFVAFLQAARGREVRGVVFLDADSEQTDREHLETHFRNAGLGVEVVVFENFGQHYAITGQVQGESVAVTADDGTHKHTRNLEFER